MPYGQIFVWEEYFAETKNAEGNPEMVSRRGAKKSNLRFARAQREGEGIISHGVHGGTENTGEEKGIQDFNHRKAQSVRHNLSQRKRIPVTCYK